MEDYPYIDDLDIRHIIDLVNNDETEWVNPSYAVKDLLTALNKANKRIKELEEENEKLKAHYEGEAFQMMMNIGEISVCEKHNITLSIKKYPEYLPCPLCKED